MSKHTPGPWKLDRRSENLIGSNGEKVRIYGSGISLSGLPDEENKANTLVVQAAAEMLDALKAAAGIIGHPEDSFSQLLQTLIAKAEGR